MAEAPISLYIDLEPGQVADIEVVARAALAFSEAIKEVVYILDPGLEVRVELASGTASSLSLNSIVRGIRERAQERPMLSAAIAIVLGWFGNYTFDELMDLIRGKEEISAEQIEEIANKCADAMQRRIAQPQVQRVYEELGNDRAVRGVGATTAHGERPRDIIPRDQFSSKAEGAILPETTEMRRRSRRRRERVLIISPVLLQSPTRRWRFRGPEGEFGAPIKDAGFLNDLIAGRLVLPMTGGVELDVLVETVEELRDRVWAPVEHTIWEVYERHFPPVQGDLLAPPEPDRDGDQ